ncbi:hypothetical protein [Hominenteromicrobium sp.]|uniref:hypothetical protein n=1 Tax=Hominenteromicrobium sp. TaxID=3073581 RepID=UPI003AF013F3
MPIKIIKPGKKPEPIHFECKHCGCVFEVNAADYDADMGGLLSPDYAAFCPTCRKWCFSKGAKEGQGNGD